MWETSTRREVQLLLGHQYMHIAAHPGFDASLNLKGQSVLCAEKLDMPLCADLSHLFFLGYQTKCKVNARQLFMSGREKVKLIFCGTVKISDGQEPNKRNWHATSNDGSNSFQSQGAFWKVAGFLLILSIILQSLFEQTIFVIVVAEVVSGKRLESIFELFVKIPNLNSDWNHHFGKKFGD